MASKNTPFSIGFFGAARTVTGSKYYITAEGQTYLVDCGLFQGLKELRLRNWAPLPFDPKNLTAVILTHAHIDHSGYLPRLVKQGFRGPIYCTYGTHELAKILLPDSGRIMEEEAEYANQKGYSKHHPALPLFTEKDAHLALSLFQPLEMEQDTKLSEHVSFELIRAGHILGSAFCIFKHGKRSLSIGFSGDVGRPHDPIMCPPLPMPKVNYLVVESTYGDREHVENDAEEQLSQVVDYIKERRSTCVIPAFAVGRSQELLYYFSRLRRRGLLKGIPIYLDSPMATTVTDLYWRCASEHRLSDDDCNEISQGVVMVRNADQSMALIRKPAPKIIISASGMATGGRVLHHLKNYLPKNENLVVFSGFQAAGTRGRRMVEGEKSIKIHGAPVPVNAKIWSVDSLSAHADQSELMDWLAASNLAPRKVFVTHGEEESSLYFADQLHRKFQWQTIVPKNGDIFEL